MHVGVRLFQTPGPKYDVVNTAVYKNKPPIYSLTSRNTMPGDSTKKPGPGAHSPEKVSTQGKLQFRRGVEEVAGA